MKIITPFNKNAYEKSAWKASKVIIGIDEVGRGCLAGPVVTAATIIPIGKKMPLLKDSKKLSEQERVRAYTWINNHTLWATSIVNNRYIDQKNIYQSTLVSMKKAVLHLLSKHQLPIESIDAILVDAMPLSLADTIFSSIPIYYFPFGEDRSISIAAASIMAKVTRDNLMAKYAALFPHYILEQHKGYSTKKHQDAIIQHGHSIIHRQQFLKKLYTQITNNDYEKQQKFC